MSAISIVHGPQPDLPVLGVDWGTSNRRAYLLDARGALQEEAEDAHGILAVASEGRGFAAALDDLLSRLMTAPDQQPEPESAPESYAHPINIILSGMVGSRSGWREVPYLDCAVPLTQLPHALYPVAFDRRDAHCFIVPGFRYRDRHGAPDVMRGEEMQVLGARALGAPDGWFVLPGTHSKWIRIADGLVTELITFMTGELFSLLSAHGTLAALMRHGADAWHADAFAAGVQAALRDGFTHAAFTCRALVVTDAMPAAHARSYLSGLLIGAELQHVGDRVGGAHLAAVQLIGAPALVARYVDALNGLGVQTMVWQPDQVYLAALRVLTGMPAETES